MPKTTTHVSRKRGITTDDLFRLRLPTMVAMAPDEKHVAYIVERMDKKENKYFANTFVCDLNTGKTTQFTQGDTADSQVCWSRDGNRLAFVSARDKKMGIYVMSSFGGAERQVIELDGAVQNLQWTPDGQQLVFGLRYNDSHFVKDEKKKKEAPVYRHISRLFYRLDGMGFVPKDTFQVYAVDVESAKLCQITKGKRDNNSPHLSPDGKMITYISNRSANQDMHLDEIDLFVIPFAGGREKKIPTQHGPVYAPRFSPNGKLIAYMGHDRPDYPYAMVHIWVVGVNGQPKAHNLMPELDRRTIDETVTDLSDVHFEGAMDWSADNKRLYYFSSDSGTTNLYSVAVRGGKPIRVFGGKCHLKGLSLNGQTRTAAIIYADLENPGDVMSCPTVSGAEKRATRHTKLNEFLKTDVSKGRTREVSFSSFDGTKIQGFLVTPPNFKPARKYPAILEVHGGPQAQYAHTFFHEMQFLAAKGYVVFYTNPRGGAGQGENWAAAIHADWGGIDYKDCMAAANYLERLPYVNTKKIGVTGGSYGGFMTNWMIGHTDRFKAAVTQRSVVDLHSFVGSSDFGFGFRHEFDGLPWTNSEVYQRCSPITYFKNVKTPILIIHNEHDLRCNIEQGEQMYTMLKLLGKKVEMVRFPEEPHGLSRHGRPDRRIARLEWIAKWFARYMK